MKYVFLCLFLTACATTDAPPVASKLQSYDLSNHAKSGRGLSRAYLKTNQSIGASHPYSRK